MRLTFDPEDPPAEPPPGCVSPTIWRLTYRLHRDHQLRDDDRCGCGDPFPCRNRRLVERGFLEALGLARGVPMLAPGVPVRSDLLDAATRSEWEAAEGGDNGP